MEQSARNPREAPLFSWGIVGSGTIARQFAGDLKHADQTIAAVSSRDAAKAERFASEAGARNAYADLDALLADPAVDAVYIATPNHLHAEQAIRAIGAGKPVLVEKPLAITSAEAEAVFEAAASRGVFVMEAMWSRFLPAAAAAKQAIGSGAIGRVERIEAELAYRRDVEADSRFFDPMLGGGAALDLGVYPLSLAMFLLGEPTAVGGGWRPAGTGVDMRSAFTLHFDAARADLSCGFDRDGENGFRVIGSEGALTLHAPFLKAQRMTIHGKWTRDLPLVGAAFSMGSTAGKLLARLPVPGRRALDLRFPGNGLQFEARHVAEAVRAGRSQSAVMPPAATLAVLRAIERVRTLPPQD